MPGVHAIPGTGSNVPLYILGSSLFGGQLAAALGLPYAFASHFAPAALNEAISAYRAEFKPSGQLDKPYVIAGINVIAADTASTARQQFQQVRRDRAASLLGRQPGTPNAALTEEQADELLASGGAFVDQMLTYTAVGTQVEVRDDLDGFIKQTEADELMTLHNALTPEERLRSVTLLAEAMQ